MFCGLPTIKMFCCTGCRKSKSKDLKQLSEQNQNDQSLKQSDPQKERVADCKNQLESASEKTLPEFTKVTNSKSEANPEKVSSNNIQHPIETSTQDTEDKIALEGSKGTKEEPEIKKESTVLESQVPVIQEQHPFKEQAITQIAVDQLLSADKDLSELLIEDMTSEQFLKAVDRLETVASRLENLPFLAGKSGSSSSDGK